MPTDGPEAQGVGRGCISERTLSRDLGPHLRSLYSMTLMLLIPYLLKAKVLGQASSFPGRTLGLILGTWYLQLMEGPVSSSTPIRASN